MLPAAHFNMCREAARCKQRGLIKGCFVQETGFFRGWGGSWDTPYGQFFLSWYSGALIAHGERMVSTATKIFTTLHPQRCTLSNHRNSSQSIINAGPLYASPGGAQVSANAPCLGPFSFSAGMLPGI